MLVLDPFIDKISNILQTAFVHISFEICVVLYKAAKTQTTLYTHRKQQTTNVLVHICVYGADINIFVECFLFDLLVLS